MAHLRGRLPLPGFLLKDPISSPSLAHAMSRYEKKKAYFCIYSQYVQYLNENLGSLQVVLTPEEVQEVREIAQRADSVLGERYPAAMQETLYQSTPAL
jgi:hypothetical protein